MTITQSITIDLARPGDGPTIHAKQGDRRARQAAIALLSEGTAWTVPAGAAGLVRYRKPDGTCGLYDKTPAGGQAVTVQGSTLLVELAPQVLTAPGPVRCEITLFTQDDALLSTFTFYVQVQGSVLTSEDLESADYYNFSSLRQINEALDRLNQQVSEAHTAANQARTAAAAAKAAAEAAQTAAQVAQAEAEKALPLAGGRMDGELHMGENSLTAAAAVEASLFRFRGEFGPVWLTSGGTPDAPDVRIVSDRGLQATTPLRNVAVPVKATDAANKAYVDQQVADLVRAVNGAGPDQSGNVQVDSGGYSSPTASSITLGGVHPMVKGQDMTQAVGMDLNGRLWTTPGGTGAALTRDALYAAFPAKKVGFVFSLGNEDGNIVHLNSNEFSAQDNFLFFVYIGGNIGMTDALRLELDGVVYEDLAWNVPTASPGALLLCTFCAGELNVVRDLGVTAVWG